MSSLIYFDFEATGLNPHYVKIIEYSFLYQNGNYISELIYPEKPIEDKITEITKITNDMVKDKPIISDKENEIFEFLKAKFIPNNKIYMVAHNSDGYDRFLLKRIFKKSKDKLKFLKNNIIYIDTIHLAKLVLPHMRSVSLATLCKIFNISPGTHRAYDDTIALKKVYEELLKIMARDFNYGKYEYLLNNPEIIWNILY